MTDWLMVIITFVYVIATIAICYYNAQTAKVSRMELDELKRQFYIINRPAVNYEVVFVVMKSLYVLRFENNGSQTAYNLSISFNDDSINEIPNDEIRNDLKRIKGTVRNLGVGQSYDVPIGRSRDETKVRLIGWVNYRGINDSIYHDDFDIDCTNYSPFYS